MELVFNLPWDGLKAASPPPFGMPRAPRRPPRISAKRGEKRAALRCGEREMRGGVERGVFIGTWRGR